MQTTLDTFRDHWKHLHDLTFSFVDAVPDELWMRSPHPRITPFAKQLRHVVCVQGVYQDGLATRRVDFGRKHAQYTGPLERAALVEALRTKDAELGQLLERIAQEPAGARIIEFFDMRPDVGRYLATMTQHEALHHGQWSLYAALGGFETPPLWRLGWGL
jgi:uncharacterized damage-inducible protein DinB